MENSVIWKHKLNANIENFQANDNMRNNDSST
jgi:hypothetical protein